MWFGSGWRPPPSWRKVRAPGGSAQQGQLSLSLTLVSLSPRSLHLQPLGGGGGLVCVRAALLPGRAWTRLPLECG